MKDSLNRDLYVGAYALWASPKGQLVVNILGEEKGKVTLRKPDGKETTVKFDSNKFFLLRDVTAASI
jgi:hypothetical protein